MMAVGMGKTSVVKEMVEAGANVNLQNKVCQGYVVYMNSWSECFSMYKMVYFM